MEHHVRLAGVIACVLLLCGFDSSRVQFDSASVYRRTEPVRLSGVLSRPEGKGPVPAVVLLHTCGGMTETMTQFWPKYLAQLGYASLAVDSLSPRGMHHCQQRPGGEMRQMVGNDAYGALYYLSGLPGIDKERIAVMGFSLGGISIAGFAVRDFATPEGLNFKAAITLYGHCSSTKPGTPPREGDPRFPWLIANGGEERESNNEACKQLQGRPGVTFTLIDGALHGFDDPRNFRMRNDSTGNAMLYSEAATAKAQALVKGFLGQHLGR